MNLDPIATGVSFEGTFLVIETDDGKKISAPIAWFPRLAKATPAQRCNYRLIGGGTGIRWDDIDEDLLVLGVIVRSACSLQLFMRRHAR